MSTAILAGFDWSMSKTPPPGTPPPSSPPREPRAPTHPQPSRPDPTPRPAPSPNNTLTAVASRGSAAEAASETAPSTAVARAAAAGPGHTARGRVPVTLMPPVVRRAVAPASGGAEHALDVGLVALSFGVRELRQAMAGATAGADVTPGWSAIDAPASHRPAGVAPSPVLDLGWATSGRVRPGRGAPVSRTVLRSLRRWAFAWSAVLVVACALALASAAAGHDGAIAPLALAALFCWGWLAATPKLLFPRGGGSR